MLWHLPDTQYHCVKYVLFVSPACSESPHGTSYPAAEALLHGGDLHVDGLAAVCGSEPHGAESDRHCRGVWLQRGGESQVGGTSLAITPVGSLRNVKIICLVHVHACVNSLRCKGMGLTRSYPQKWHDTLLIPLM